MNTLNTLKTKLAALSLALLSAVTAAASVGTITNPTSTATVWRDTAGVDVINNGGNILHVGATFYWYGWNKYTKTVNCYTSTTLGSADWTKVTENGFPMFGSGFHGRPDVIARTNADGTVTYVMIVACNSVLGRNGIEYLTSDSPTGPFTSVLKEDFVVGGTITIGDKGVYQDDDANQTAYLLCTTDDGGNTNGTHKIIRLNADYIGQAEVIKSWGPVTTNRREALAIVKHNGTYIMTSSGTHGWNSGETWYKTSSSIDGTWTGWANMPTDPSSTNSFNTQHDFVLKITGTTTTSFIYCGDRWSQDTGDGFGRNAWYPVTFDGNGVPTIQGDDEWTINPVSGVINGAQQTLTFAPTKDAMVKEAAPATNFGTGTQMQVSGKPGYSKQMFLQFDVSGIPSGAVITGASLLLAAQTTATGRNIAANAVASTSWSETGITWNNKPALGAYLSTASDHIAGQDSVWDVSAQVTDNGNVAIGLDSTYSGDTNFYSRESSAANAPELVVTYLP